jgi:segregation and condensation protein A
MSEPTDTAEQTVGDRGELEAARDSARTEARPETGSEGATAGGYQVTLPTFEGPLDLLLHLISEHKLDILDIPISFVSQKYVEYILLMQDLNIDLASEYLVMAATLAHIKSKMLLPAPPEGQDDELGDELDPRAELVRRLLEYQKYKQASEELLSSSVLGRDVFLRGPTAERVEGEAPLAPVSVFKLLDAFQRMLGRVKQTADHLIDVDRISISERILQLVDLLEGRGPTIFDELLVGEITKADLVVTFLALLEMTRLRMMQVLQAGPLSPLYVELTLSDEQQKVLKRDPGDGDPLAALWGGESAALGDPGHPEAEDPGETTAP